MIWLWMLCAALALAVVLLLVKIRLLQTAADEVRAGFTARLESDTNTLLDLSCRDRHMRRLAGEINGQLRLLRRERRRFLQGDRELKEAVTHISHDLRTPLTAVCGYLDLLERETLPEPAGRYVEMIRNRTEVLKQLTEELFRYSVVASAGADEPLEPVCLNRVLEESLAAYYGALTEHGITPDISLPDAPVVRLLRRGALSRIFANILTNAVKYSGGDLAVSMTPAGRIAFSNSAPGLDAVLAGRLFDRYYTVETGAGSTGLGLSIARLLTEHQGGSIAADCRDGVLTITLDFPAPDGPNV